MRFAFICVPQTGHIAPMAALARELVERGHSVTFVHHPDVEPLIRARDLDFFPVGRTTSYTGSLEAVLRCRHKVQAALGLSALMRDFAKTTAMLCQELPRALRALSIDVVVGDWVEAAAGLVAEHMGLPFISVAAALPFNWEKDVPSPYVGWAYGETRWHRARNIAAHSVAIRIQQPLREVISFYAAQWKLGPKWKLGDCASGFAQIAQLVPSLDYPRRSLIGCFHYCGPLREPSPHDRQSSAHNGSGRAFASLGSMQGHRVDIFDRIVDAASTCGLDLTIAHGGRLSAADSKRLGRRATVVDFVDYGSVFASTEIAIMHGGMNGVLDALAHGVPLVVVPISFEQPAIGARVEYAGVGQACRSGRLRAKLAGSIGEVRGDLRYRLNAAKLRNEIMRAGGASRAADIVEQVAETGRPCLNADAVAADPALASYALRNAA